MHRLLSRLASLTLRTPVTAVVPVRYIHVAPVSQHFNSVAVARAAQAAAVKGIPLDPNAAKIVCCG